MTPAERAELGTELHKAAERLADPYAGVTAERAVRGVLAMAGFPMGPDEAADRAVAAVRAFDARTLPVCACSYLVAVCEHRQPWTRA